MARIIEAMQRELSKDCPVIVGPWTGEVGYELLYWIPFVRWALTNCGVRAQKVIVVSRGGTASWYSGVSLHRYVDVFDVMSAAEFAAFGGAKPKQSAWSDESGEDLVERVKNACGLTEAARLPPHWMYRLYRYYWDGDAPLDFVEQHAVWAPVIPPEPPRLVPPLPRTYLAVRFYFSRSFPETDENRRFARDMIERIAAHRSVVLLNHQHAVDDHSDYKPGIESVVSVAGAMAASTNLAVQTAVIGRAAAFIGTYGGLSLLPPICRVPSYAFDSVRFMKASHAKAISRMIERAEGSPLYVANAGDGRRQADAILTEVSAN